MLHPNPCDCGNPGGCNTNESNTYYIPSTYTVNSIDPTQEAAWNAATTWIAKVSSKTPQFFSSAKEAGKAWRDFVNAAMGLDE